MPRGPRNYAAEYLRRLELERERASQEGRPFDRSKARGHTNRERENTRRRVKTLWRQNKALFGKQYPGWDSVKGAAANYSWAEVEETLKQQQRSVDAYKLGNPLPGRVKYDAAKATVYPIEFFWYHGS